MAIYRDLNEPLADWLAKRLSEKATETSPTGIKDLGSTGDVVWTGEGGTPVSVRDMRADIDDLLAEGVSLSKKNTVSTSNPPASTDGYPEGAWWTKVTSQDDTTVVGLWQVEDGAWVARSIPDGGLVAPYADIGLMSVAMLSAKIITSGYFRTAASGKRVEIDEDGIRAYDDSGKQTVDIDGVDNILEGDLWAGDQSDPTRAIRVGSGSSGTVEPYGIYFGNGSEAMPPRIAYRADTTFPMALALASGCPQSFDDVIESRISLMPGYVSVIAGAGGGVGSGKGLKMGTDGSSVSTDLAGDTVSVSADGNGWTGGHLFLDGDAAYLSHGSDSARNPSVIRFKGDAASATMRYGTGAYVTASSNGLNLDGYRWTPKICTSTADGTLGTWTAGRYDIRFNHPDLPTSKWGLLDIDTRTNGTWYYSYRTDVGDEYWTRTFANGAWSTWRNLLAEQTSNGSIAWNQTTGGGGTVRKYGGLVWLNVATVTIQTEVIGTISTGFRPPMDIGFVGLNESTNSPQKMWILANGTIHVQSPTPGQKASCTTSYPAA